MVEHIKDFKIEAVPHHAIALVATNIDSYEADRTMVVSGWPEWGDFAIVEGGHCSCYGFDEVKWEATIYTEAELRKVATGWLTQSYGSEKMVAPLILDFLGPER